ncbi:fructokinase-like 1 [Wolffia australiana]
MASAYLFSPLSVSHAQRLGASRRQSWRASRLNLGAAMATASAAAEAPKPARRGRKKAESPAKTTTAKKKKPKKETAAEETEEEEEIDFDDGMDFPYEWPPLVCCFGAAQREFVPTVRVSDRQMHPDQYSSWKGLQWNPPEFARAPGGPASNVAVALCRLGGRAAFMGKVGDDDYGRDLVHRMNLEKVQTRAVRVDPGARTGAARMKLSFREGDGGLTAETAAACAEDSLRGAELDLAVLKEAKLLHLTSAALLEPATRAAAFRAMRACRQWGGDVFLDVNLALPLWRSREAAWAAVGAAWRAAAAVEVTKQELEFLLDEAEYERRRNYRPQYFSETVEQSKGRRDYYHYTREELAGLWHEGMKLLLVTDGTLRVHYYTPEWDGVVVGTEDVLITPFTCDRTGSGDALVAGVLRKLAAHPEMWRQRAELERHLRFAIAAGIISQWTVGAVRGFPTESAAQNLKEQVYVPSMW